MIYGRRGSSTSLTYTGATTGPQLLGWGTNNLLVPQLLGRSFQKQEISQQVVTRMQDLASEFSKKNFPGVIPRTLTAGEGDPLQRE